jgi:hypothetical protein
MAPCPSGLSFLAYEMRLRIMKFTMMRVSCSISIIHFVGLVENTYAMLISINQELQLRHDNVWSTLPELF